MCVLSTAVVVSIPRGSTFEPSQYIFSVLSTVFRRHLVRSQGKPIRKLYAYNAMIFSKTSCSLAKTSSLLPFTKGISPEARATILAPFPFASKTLDRNLFFKTLKK